MSPLSRNISGNTASTDIRFKSRHFLFAVQLVSWLSAIDRASPSCRTFPAPALRTNTFRQSAPALATTTSASNEHTCLLASQLVSRSLSDFLACEQHTTLHRQSEMRCKATLRLGVYTNMHQFHSSTQYFAALPKTFVCRQNHNTRRRVGRALCPDVSGRG